MTMVDIYVSLHSYLPRNTFQYVKPPKFDFEPKYKKKGKSKAGKIEQRKQAVRDQHKRTFIKDVKQIQQLAAEEETQEKAAVEYDVLGRFSKKSS